MTVEDSFEMEVASKSARSAVLLAWKAKKCLDLWNDLMEYREAETKYGGKFEEASRGVLIISKILSWCLKLCPKIHRLNLHGVEGMNLTVKAIENLEKLEKID